MAPGALGFAQPVRLSNGFAAGQRLAMQSTGPAKPAAAARTETVCSLKKWKKLPLNKNGNPEFVKMHVRTGDTVKVISGKDKGVVSVIEKVDRKRGTVVVKDVNIKTKHKAPRNEDEKGEIVKITAPIHHSNVAVWSEKEQKTSKVAWKVDEATGKKVRYMKDTGELLSS